MRMWEVPCELLCDQHLRGEHSELHMFVGVIETRCSLKGYLDAGQLHANRLKGRHEEVAKAMSQRSGEEHKSPLPDFMISPEIGNINNIDFDFNLEDLCSRCYLCETRIQEWQQTGKVPYLKDAIAYRSLGRKDDRRGANKKASINIIPSDQVKEGDNLLIGGKIFQLFSQTAAKLCIFDNGKRYYSLDVSQTRGLEVIGRS